jgi:hypothetical protein
MRGGFGRWDVGDREFTQNPCGKISYELKRGVMRVKIIRILSD